MKTTITLLLIITLFAVSKAQDDKYLAIMKETITEMDSAKTIADMLEVANKFERIGTTMEKEWLPNYYASMSYVLINFMGVSKDSMDIYLDKAQLLLDKCIKVDKKESELYTLQGFIQQARIAVNPMGRGMQYSQMANESFAKAVKLNPKNPRPEYLQGQSTMYTPKMFGGGKKNALPLFEASKKKFEEFELESEIHPKWGQERNELLYEQCLDKPKEKKDKKEKE